MPIRSEIRQLITRINDEIQQIEQQAIEGLNITLISLTQFPNNVVLLQFFAAFNNILLFVEIYERRVQTILQQIEAENVPTDIITEAGEDLGTILGQILEVKINVSNLRKRLEN